MPRKHSHPKHQPYQHSGSSKPKTRYDSHQQAEQAAQRIMLEQGGNLEISVYQDIDGGWYLTSRR